MVPDLIPVPGHIFNSRPLFFSLSLSPFFFSPLLLSQFEEPQEAVFVRLACIIYELYVMQPFMVMHFLYTCMHRQILLLLFVNRIKFYMLRVIIKF